MSSLFTSLKNLFASTVDAEQARDDGFLAAATDLRDLERRIRLVDAGRHHLDATPYGIFMPRA